MLILAPLAAALTLDDAWRAAERGSDEAALVAEQYRAAATIRGAAWSLVSPKLVLRGSYTRNDEQLTFDPSSLIPEDFSGLVDAGDPIVVRPLQYADASVSVIQPLFSGTAIPLLRAAYAQVAAADADRRVQLRAIRKGVATAFWGALVARQGVVIASAASDSAERHLALARELGALVRAPRTA